MLSEEIVRLRNRIITGTYAIGPEGKEPTNWHDYALKLEAHILKLELTMIAAAEEIQEHWQAHCDEDGYGPSNLMHRLENGIASNYDGYKFGQFSKLQEENVNLKIDMMKSLTNLNNKLAEYQEHLSSDVKVMWNEIYEKFAGECKHRDYKENLLLKEVRIWKSVEFERPEIAVIVCVMLKGSDSCHVGFRANGGWYLFNLVSKTWIPNDNKMGVTHWQKLPQILGTDRQT